MLRKLIAVVTLVGMSAGAARAEDAIVYFDQTGAKTLLTAKMIEGMSADDVKKALAAVKTSYKTLLAKDADLADKMAQKDDKAADGIESELAKAKDASPLDSANTLDEAQAQALAIAKNNADIDNKVQQLERMKASLVPPPPPAPVSSGDDGGCGGGGYGFCNQ